MKRLFLLCLIPGVLSGCASDELDVTETVGDLTASQRLARETVVRDVAAQHGLRNGMLLAGLAEAEVFLQHCWSEATWACQGPFSSECNGPVVAGSGDGACSLRRGGLGMFQFDRGTYDDTIAAHGQKILNVAGSAEEAVTFVANMAINSIYTPANVVDRASALAWLDGVTIDGPTYDAWLKTVVHYYNGCVPGECSYYQQRWQKYDTAMRTVWNERGAAFWQGTTNTSSTWVQPLASTTWRIEFDIVNPSVAGNSSCFGKPLNQLVHAGEDWGTAAGTGVKAIGAGTVVYAANANYPGNVVVIRHDLTETQRVALGISTPTIYSQYGHLGTIQVGVGNQVTAGQQIGTIYNWSGNSHLHWEVRTAEKPQLCGYNHPGPGYTNTGTHPQTWGYLDPANAVATLAGAGTPTTCDNNVPLNGTACAAQGQSVEYVCKRPGQPSSQQWDVQSCGAGETCQGNACTGGGGGTCAAQTSASSCDAQGGACAWYACANSCQPAGTDINQVCPQWCSTQTSLSSCNATGGSCAWYACANACRPQGTPIEQVCPSSGWNCADSAWGTSQLWTCGSDGERHKCVNGSPVVDNCSNGCMQRSPGQDDLCVQSAPGWSCANSSWNGGQLWTCSGGDIHQCQSGAPVKVDCPLGCMSNPLGTNDACY
jgi:hypothetical protein